MLHVMLTIINDTEPLLVVFQAERLLSLFVPEKLKEVVSLLHRVTLAVVLENYKASKTGF